MFHNIAYKKNLKNLKQKTQSNGDKLNLCDLRTSLRMTIATTFMHARAKTLCD